MRYMLAFIFIVFATCMAFAVNAADYFNPGDKVGIVFMCKSENAILAVADADTKSLAATRAMIQTQSKAGECVMLPQRMGVILQSRVFTYTDYDGAASEVWSIMSRNAPIFVIVAQPAPKRASE